MPTPTPAASVVATPEASPSPSPSPSSSLSSQYSRSPDPEGFFDVLVVGGGAVGCCMTRQIASDAPHLRIGLLEAQDAPKPIQTQHHGQSQSQFQATMPNPRSYALSPNSLAMLGEQVRQRLHDDGRLGYYDSMQVWQSGSPASLVFTSKDIPRKKNKHNHTENKMSEMLGATAEDHAIVAALWQELQGAQNVVCYTNTTLTNIESVGDDSANVQVVTSSGDLIQASLLIAADGARSWVRDEIGIPRIGIEYNHHALTFTVEIKESLGRRAFQRFLNDGGPLALLPTFSDKHAVIVWSTAPDTIAHWKAADPKDLVAFLNECLSEGLQLVPPLFDLSNSNMSQHSILSNFMFGVEKVVETAHYGLAMASQYPEPLFAAPPEITSIVSPKFSFPLSCYHVHHYTKGRIALIGDAAHTVHPMAGQGLNLGLSDVQILSHCIQKAVSSGMGLHAFLHEYDGHRQRNNAVALGGIHILQRLFGNQTDVPLQHAKTFGMNVVQAVGPLRRQLAAAATHGVSI